MLYTYIYIYIYIYICLKIILTLIYIKSRIIRIYRWTHHVECNLQMNNLQITYNNICINFLPLEDWLFQKWSEYCLNYDIYLYIKLLICMLIKLLYIKNRRIVYLCTFITLFIYLFTYGKLKINIF